MKGAFSMVAILFLAGTALCAAGQGQVDFPISLHALPGPCEILVNPCKSLQIRAKHSLGQPEVLQSMPESVADVSKPVRELSK